jgi:putative transposase
MNVKFDPQKHHRRSIRLREWDYSSAGAYFITICTYERMNLFENGEFREIAENAWRTIPNQPHAQHVLLDDWVVMPNHVHGIIILEESNDLSNSDQPEKGVMPGSVPSIVGNYKSLVTRRINNVRRTRGSKVWQRNYYERIVRNARELNAIREYIRANPMRWAKDRDNLDTLISRMQKH